MRHIPADALYVCPSPHCKATIVPGDSPPDASMTNDSKRRAEQRKHFGGVPGRLLFTSIPLKDYIIYALHLILRVVPFLFRQTIQANGNKATMEMAALWIYDKCVVIISDLDALQTVTSLKKLCMSVESCHGNVCREIMD